MTTTDLYGLPITKQEAFDYINETCTAFEMAELKNVRRFKFADVLRCYNRLMTCADAAYLEGAVRAITRLSKTKH